MFSPIKPARPPHRSAVWQSSVQCDTVSDNYVLMIGRSERNIFGKLAGHDWHHLHMGFMGFLGGLKSRP